MGFIIVVLGAILAADQSGVKPESLARETAEAEDAEVQGAAGASPIELIPRIEVRSAFAQLANGASASTTTAQMDLTFARRVLLRYELPHVRVENAGMQSSGLGDLHLQGIGVLTAGPSQVTALVVGLVLDTATAPPLGTGKQQVSFGAGGALKVRRFWLPYVIAQEQLSFAGDESRPDVNQLHVRAGSILFGRRWDWYKADLDTIVDFRADLARLFGTLEVGSLLVGRVGLFLRAGTQLAGQRELDYTVQAGIRYLFRLEATRPRPRAEGSGGGR
jgi:hypothetical protein